MPLNPKNSRSRKRERIIFASFVALAASSVCGDKTNQNPLTAALVTVVHDRDEFFLGENVIVHYRIGNAGAQPVPYEKGGFFPTFRRNDGFKVTAIPVDRTGKKIGDAVQEIPEPQSLGGPISSWKLKPGEVYEQTLYLPRYLRFENPGRYRIRIANVSRWEAKREFSMGETTILFKLPSPDEARDVVERMKKLPRGPIAGTGEKGQEVADFQVLLHPIYLPILTEYARRKDGDAIEAIGNMHTVEARKGLVHLIEQGLREDDLSFASSVYQRMRESLPDPRFYPDAKTNSSAHDWYAPQRAFVERTWRPEFAETLRRLARRLARNTDQNSLKASGFIFECVGTAEDMPDAIVGFANAIEATKTLPFETQYFRPRGAAYGYRFTARQLLKRGAKVPTDSKTTGEAAVYFIAMQTQKNLRPERWQEQVIRWLRHETPYMQEFVLEHTPEPIPDGVLKLLPTLLSNSYVDLQIAACKTAGNHPRDIFREPLLAILRRGTEQHLLNAAAATAPPNGITQDLLLEIWLGRIDNNDLGGSAVVRLLTTALAGDPASSWPKLDPQIRVATTARWSRFIEENREKLRRGDRFKLGDPEVTSDLFPPGFQLYFDGKRWPPSS